MSNRHSSGVRAVFYLRMSDDKQDKSIEQQRDELRRLVERTGYSVVREYADHGISGDDTERRVEFKRMIRDAKELADFDLILCYDLSRFGRFDNIEAGYWIKPLRDAGVQLETYAEGKADWDTFAGRMTSAMMQEAKHALLLDISRTSTRGSLAKAKRGEWLGGKAPYGYRLNEAKRLVPGDAVEVEAVRFMFDTYARGAVSLGDLVRILEAKGYPSPGEVERRAGKHQGRREGLRWQKTAVHKILMRPTYLGHSVWNRRHVGNYHGIKGGEVGVAARKPKNAIRANDPSDWVRFPDTHEALVDQATFDRVQQRLVENRDNSSPKKNGRIFLFTGLLWCGHCSWPMHGATQRYSSREGATARYSRYICGNYNLHGAAVCRCNTIVERLILSVLVRKLRTDFLKPENTEAMRAEIRRQEEAERRGEPGPSAALDTRIAELDKLIDEGAEKYFRAPPSLTTILGEKLEQYRAERERLHSERRTVARPAASVEDFDAAVRRIAAGLDVLEERAEEADPKALRELVFAMVEKVELWFEHKPYGTKRFKSVLTRGLIHLREDLIVSRPVLIGSPKGTGLERLKALLRMSFDRSDVEACQGAPVAVVPLGGAGGNLAGCRVELPSV